MTRTEQAVRFALWARSLDDLAQVTITPEIIADAKAAADLIEQMFGPKRPRGGRPRDEAPSADALRKREARAKK
jgi:hypothetical protein